MIQLAAQTDTPQTGTSNASLPPLHKTYAYIVQFDRLLVFREPDFPEAGIQIPGGTVEEGETYSQAVLREAAEETGLSKLRLVRKLGVREREGIDEGATPILDHFFHLTIDESLPEKWQHTEKTPFNGGEPILFELFWVKLKDAHSVLWPWQSHFLKSFD